MSHGKSNGKASLPESPTGARANGESSGGADGGAEHERDDEDLEGAARSTSGTGATGSAGAGGAGAEDEPDGGMPPAIADLVAACVRFVATRYRVPLDFSSDTLSLVDQYVRDSRGEIAVRPESLELLSATIGAYLGEVVRREQGGYWRTDGDPSSWRVLLSRVFLAFNPIGMAREALTLSDAEGFGAYLQLDEAEREDVEARLAVLPEIDEADFYLPTTRFEVVQIACAALRAKMEASGLGAVRFTPDDYE
jgi:hypothetical protein